jgi:hypothetical protein
MADKKISGLTVVTSVTPTDVLPIVQSSNTKKVSITTLFGDIPVDMKYSGLLQSSVQPETITSGNLSVLVPISFIVNQTGADSSLILPAGSLNLEKTILATDLTTNKVVVSITGQSFTALTFNSTGSSARLIYTNNKWFILSLYNVTAS